MPLLLLKLFIELILEATKMLCSAIATSQNSDNNNSFEDSND